MAQKVTLYKIFVASPSDVREERNSLEEIIEEINLSMLSSNNIRVELVRWETHANPDIAEYPQKVINDDIPYDYDIFLGILWGKFGTPTKDYNSGTEEEFYNAYERYKKDPTSIKIMIYFNQSPIPIDKIDTVSIDLIRKLRSDLDGKGILFWDYTTIEEFQRLLRIQLSRQINDLHQNLQPTSKIIKSKEEVIETSEDEFGLLDFIEFGEEYFATVQEILLRMTAAIEWIGKKFTEKTEEINLQNKLNPQLSTKARKYLIDSSANDMETFVKRLKVEIPLFAETYRNGIDNFSAGLKISMDIKADPVEDIVGAINSLGIAITAMTGSRDQCISFRDIFTHFPSMTKTFNQSRRLAAQTLDDLIKEFDIAINLTEALTSEFNEYLKKY
jgi:hypothetical protein